LYRCVCASPLPSLSWARLLSMASILPLSFPSARQSNPASAFGSRIFTLGESRKVRVPLVLRRMIRVSHMDFELAAWQLTYLCIAPRLVYKHLFYHKQTKNMWSRDDPAMVLLVSACLLLSAIAWGIVCGYTIWGIVNLALLMILRDFFTVGVAVATGVWVFSKFFLVPSTPISHQTESTLEWAYAFDVHTNSFFPFYLWLYLVQLFLATLIARDRWLCLWLGNTLYLAAFTQYTYITYLGLNALPFLIRSELLLFPLIPLLLTYIVSLLGFNISKAVLAVYFG